MKNKEFLNTEYSTEFTSYGTQVAGFPEVLPNGKI